MRKTMLTAAAVLLCLFSAAFLSAALAEDYSFPDICAALSLPSGVYQQVVTKENLAEKTDFLISQGYDMDYVHSDFEQEGLLMMAFDTKNDRRFLLTAVQDVDARNYFDLNEQGEDMRKKFRVSHTDGSAYGLLGYDYSTATWKNYGGTTLRFLQTRYTLRQSGALMWGGAQRRTIRNGYTITLDLQTPGRKVTDEDVKALETVMKNWRFTTVLPLPELPIKLLLSSEPPLETHDDTFTVKGTTLAKAEVTVNVITVSGTQSQNYTATANGSGNFSVKVKLPSRGVYAVSMTVSKQGSLDTTRTWSVTFDPNRLIAMVTLAPADELGNETEIRGTTEQGVTTSLIISGPVELIKTSTSKSFSFTVDTSAEGVYSFRLVMTKKGFNERSFEYTGTRTVTQEERLSQLKEGAIKPDYSRLLASSSSYDGKIFGYTGWLVECRQGEDSWLYTVALAKSGASYKNPIYVVSETPVSFSAGDKVTVYATKSGEIVSLDNGKSVSIPKFELLLLEAAE